MHRLAIFDFDGTLFASPSRPDWWPHQGFWGRPESLSPPYVPEVPGAEWWSDDVVEAARIAITDPTTTSAMITGRPRKLQGRVTQLLTGYGLHFDHVILAGDGNSTLESKLKHFRELAADVSFVEVWEDRFEHVAPFQEHLDSLGVVSIVHLVERVCRPFENEPVT